MHLSALDVAREISSELMSGGAEAVVLVGSAARKEATSESDLDLLAIGEGGYDCRLRVAYGLLVSVSEQTFDEFRRDFVNPQKVCAAVPGWREAVILADPAGLAASLVDEARQWDWSLVGNECDAWVAEEITGYSEEVHKLASSLKSGSLSTSAAQRSILATRLALVMAVHRRALYGSENRLWNLVSRDMGQRFREEQSIALGLCDKPFEETCVAALRLYEIAASEIEVLLNPRQRRVVEKSLALIRQSASL